MPAADPTNDQRFLAQADQFGAFSPFGSPALMARLKRQALRQSGNIRNRGAVLSQFMGLDPTQARGAALNYDAAATGQQADYLNNAQLQQLQGGQDFGRQLYFNRLGQSDQMQQLKLQQQMQKDAQKAQMIGSLGQLGGAAIGAYRGGPAGASAGKKLAGG